MKQVISKCQNYGITAIENVDEALYYGIQLRGGRGFVSRESGRSFDAIYGDFIILCPKQITLGNGWGSFDARTLELLLRGVIKADDDNRVFEFDTPKELFDWVTELLD